MRATSTFLAMCLAFAAVAHASVITFHYSGVITQVPIDDIFGDIAAGDAFQGHYTFDSSATDLIPANSTTGSYSFTAPLGLIATIGSRSFNATGELNIGVVNGFLDQYTVFAQNGDGLTIGFLLQDNSAAVLNTDELPLSAPPLAAFTQAQFNLVLVIDGKELQVDGQLDALTAAPEPNSFLLSLPALFVLTYSLGSCTRSRSLLMSHPRLQTKITPHRRE